jgi:hypothetical protein
MICELCELVGLTWTAHLQVIISENVFEQHLPYFVHPHGSPAPQSFPFPSERNSRFSTSGPEAQASHSRRSFSALSTPFNRTLVFEVGTSGESYSWTLVEESGIGLRDSNGACAIVVRRRSAHCRGSDPGSPLEIPPSVSVGKLARLKLWILTFVLSLLQLPLHNYWLPCLGSVVCAVAGPSTSGIIPFPPLLPPPRQQRDASAASQSPPYVSNCIASTAPSTEARKQSKGSQL